MPQLKNEGETFGEWLFAQKDRKAAIADLINSAKADRGFPRPDSPDDVRMHLNEMQAAGHTPPVIDDSETDRLRC